MLSHESYVSLPSVLLPRGRALVIDQNRKDLQSYTETLRRMGFEVKPFTSYQEASRCLEEETPDFVFVNQGTAAFEGRVIVDRAIARNRHTPVVVVAQSIHMACYLEAMQLGAVDYVEKPLASAEVEHLVTTYWQPRMTTWPKSA
jgi:DNA-binding NtrC family response regulator